MSNKKNILFTLIGIMVIVSSVFIVKTLNIGYDDKPGNLKSMDYWIETNLKMEFIRENIDSLIYEKYNPDNVPASLKMYASEWKDLPHNFNSRKIYFKSEPEEMYLVALDFGVRILNVYNVKLRADDWVTNPKYISKSDEKRIRKRFQDEILNVLEKKNKQ